MTKARLFQFAVALCFVVFALTATLSILPDGMYDGAD